MRGLPEELVDLRTLVGDLPLESLRRRQTVLQVWRRSSPHNWWIENRYQQMLWHSIHGDPTPNLKLFELVQHADVKIQALAGARWVLGLDQGAPQGSTYRLKSQYCLKGSPWYLEEE